MISKKNLAFEFAGIFLIGIIIVLFNIGFIIRGIRGRAVGRPAQISIDAKIFNNKPVQQDFYHAFAQGGEEKTDMISPVISQVSALKPRYIRLDHIYDGYDVVTRVSGRLEYSFSKLDQAIDTIRKTGAIPVMVLSYMPSAISKDGSVLSEPQNWNEWSDVVKKTIEHYSGKSGRNFKGVIYEVWNEPDLVQFGGWKTYGNKNYLELYRYSVIGAQSAQNVNTFMIGGPSTTGLYKSWIDGLLSSNLRVDFLSWHTYADEPRKFRDDQNNLSKWLLSYPRYVNIQRMITEFGFTGDKDRRYGTNFAAAFQAAVVRQMSDVVNTNLFTFQLKDGPNQDDGKGWGIIAHETKGAFVKPRYRVFEYLDAIKGLRLSLLGEGTWVSGYAAKDGDIIRALLINYDPESTHEESFPVRFENLVSGTYTLRQKYFLGQNLSSKETVPGSSLVKTFYLGPNNLLLLELEKNP